MEIINNAGDSGIICGWEKNAFLSLRNAIVEQAVRDYVRQLRVENPVFEYPESTASAFFKSPWFEFLTGGWDGEELMQKIEERVSSGKSAQKRRRWKDTRRKDGSYINQGIVERLIRVRRNGKK